MKLQFHHLPHVIEFLMLIQSVEEVEVLLKPDGMITIGSILVSQGLKIPHVACILRPLTAGEWQFLANLCWEPLDIQDVDSFGLSRQRVQLNSRESSALINLGVQIFWQEEWKGNSSTKLGIIQSLHKSNGNRFPNNPFNLIGAPELLRWDISRVISLPLLLFFLPQLFIHEFLCQAAVNVIMDWHEKGRDLKLGKIFWFYGDQGGHQRSCFGIGYRVRGVI